MSIYQRLTEKVAIFGPAAPWTARLSFVLFVVFWFWELNVSLRMLASTNFTHQSPTRDPAQVPASMVFFIAWAAWQLFNLVLVTGVAFRANWARLTQLVVTVLELLCVLTMQFHIGPFYVTTVAATVLLFVPTATAWFRGEHR